MLSEDWLAARAALCPESEALVAGRSRWTWAELAARVEEDTARLAPHVTTPGSLVALRLAPGEHFVRWLHAAWACGARVLSLNTRLTRREIGAACARVGAAEPIAGATLPDRPAATETPRPGDALLLFTSGTSAAPKAVRLTFDNLRASAEAAAAHNGAARDDRWLSCLPWFHVGGLSILTRSVLCGAAVIAHQRFDAAGVWQTLGDEGITHVSLVPTTLKRLLDHSSDRAPTTLRSVLLGGAPAPPELIDRAAQRGFPVVATYGMTECASQIATARPDAPRELFALPGVELRIASRDAEGDGGEIQVRGAIVSPGMEGEPPRAAGDWLSTGDVGSLGAGGRLAVWDRGDDLILTGGENVAPAEVEAALLSHAAVDEVAVAGLADPDLGQRVAAWVVLRPGGVPDAEALRAHLRERLAGYKIPRAFAFERELPRNAMGKVVRSALATRA